MAIYSQSGAFLMQNWNACVVTAAVPSPCGIFHYFTAAMNFWPDVSVILDTHGFEWQSSGLCIHLTFTATVGSVLEQGEYIHTTATLMTAAVAGSQWALSLLKTPLTTHSPKCLAAVGEGIMSSSKATLRFQPTSYYYYPSFNNNHKNHGHEITKTKRKLAEAVSDFFFSDSQYRYLI